MKAGAGMPRFLRMAVAAFLATYLGSAMTKAQQLNSLPPPIQASPLQYSSPYGPRDIVDPIANTGTYQFHRGVDYKYPVGTPVSAVQGSTIDFIGFDAASGWYISIQGGPGDPVPSARFSYLHLFDNLSPNCTSTLLPTDPEGNTICATTSDNSNNEVVTLENLNPQSCFAIIFWTSFTNDQPDKALSPCAGIPVGNPTFGIQTTMQVSEGELIAVVGQSGKAAGHPHLHLQVNYGYQNELLYVQHDNSNPPGYPMSIFKDKGADVTTLNANQVQLNGGEVLDPFQDSPLTIRAETSYSDFGHDLNQAQISMCNGTNASPPCYGNVLFDYGGGPSDSRNVPFGYADLNPTVLQQGVYPQPLRGGVVDFLTHPIDLMTVGPGLYSISVRATDILDEVLPVSVPVIRPAILKVTIDGTGTGTVSPSPAPLVTCPPSATTNCYEYGFDAQDNPTTVTLTATPNAGSTFAGWTGDCTGTNASTTVVMGSDKTCTATFNPSVPVTITGGGVSQQSGTAVRMPYFYEVPGFGGGFELEYFQNIVYPTQVQNLTVPVTFPANAMATFSKSATFDSSQVQAQLQSNGWILDTPFVVTGTVGGSASLLLDIASFTMNSSATSSSTTSMPNFSGGVPDLGIAGTYQSWTMYVQFSVRQPVNYVLSGSFSLAPQSNSGPVGALVPTGSDALLSLYSANSYLVNVGASANSNVAKSGVLQPGNYTFAGEVNAGADSNQLQSPGNAHASLNAVLTLSPVP